MTNNNVRFDLTYVETSSQFVNIANDVDIPSGSRLIEHGDSNFLFNTRFTSEQQLQVLQNGQAIPLQTPTKDSDLNRLDSLVESACCGELTELCTKSCVHDVLFATLS